MTTLVGASTWRTILWGALLVVVLAAIVGIIAFWVVTQAPRTDPETNCRLDRRDPAHVVVLIDQSDPFRESDLQWVEQVLHNETNAVATYGRVSALALTSTPYEPSLLFSRCSPGSPEGVNEAFRNKAFVELEWRRQLFNPLMGVTREALVNLRQDRSPIAEAIVEIASRSDFTSAVPQRRIVIISDMLQNSPDYSYYDSGLSVSRFESALGSVMPDLTGVEVSVHIVPRRSHNVDVRRLEGFWRQAIERQGGSFSVQ